MKRLQFSILSGILLLSFQGQGQGIQPKYDTVTVMDGFAKLLVISEDAFKIEKRKAILKKEYTDKYAMNNLHCVSGFSNGGVSYRFYHTTLQNPNLNDYGVSTWKLISLFTDKVPESDWLKSGLEIVGGNTIYYVDMISMKQGEEKFLRFYFFNHEENLVFISFDSPLSLQKTNSLPDINHLMISYRKDTP